jgi:membrane associated rhomboid family serine protease
MRLSIALIALNLLVFAYQATLSPEEYDLFVLRWSVVPVEIVERNDLEPQVPFPVAGTLLSALFLHADLLHLGTNMGLLALFGPRAEGGLGPWRALGLYLLGGVAGGLVQIAADPLSLTSILGASGAIAALMGLAILLPSLPTAHLLAFCAWAAIQAAMVADGLLNWRSLGGGVAVWSHIAGLAVGLAVGLWLRREKASGRV